MSRSVLFVFLLLLYLLPEPSLSLNQEGLFLLQFKSGLDGPTGALSDWNPRDVTPCNWTGVSCTATGAVAGLNLYNQSLQGPFDPVLCRLPYLSNVSLSYNYINSTLPDAALSRCSALADLDLSMNCLVGPLPAALASLPRLRRLNLDSNNFSGPIPAAFNGFPVLESLSIVFNLLTGTIPAVLGEIGTLQELNLAYNTFSPGPIPPEIGNLSALRNLLLTDCKLIGSIPPSLGNLRKLANLDLSMNNLEGPIPETLTELSSVVQIELYKNSLTGHIPEGLGKLPALRRFDASMNLLEGTIPPSFFDLPLLESFHLYQNHLAGGLPASIARAGSLSELRLHMNRLNGTLPPDLGSKSPLVVVELSQNQFSGEIPGSICDRGSLEQLMLIGNFFSGTLPEGLGRCKTLWRVRLRKNLLSGEVPAGMWGLPHVSLLDLMGNSFSGVISPSISDARNLSSLTISDNQFAGEIPEEIGALTGLYEFSASDNRLTGPLPSALGRLAGLQILDLHNNSLSGEIPREIQAWQHLSELNLAGNGLTGAIPPELGGLAVLNYLDLSNNLLTGSIPPELQNLKLNIFNLSNNQLSGDVPPLYASKGYRDSLLGNPGLCGELPGLCPASSGGPEGKQHLIIFLFIIALAVLILLIGVVCFYWKYGAYLKASRWGRKSSRKSWRLTSFHKVTFPEREILDAALDESNLIGAGASGKVYRAVLSDGSTVAVKKLFRPGKNNLEGEKDAAFEAEIETLGRVRHKNIVRLWCCCTHDDHKLLVYEYLPNGSLGDLLHGGKAGRCLDWPARYKIAVDVAEGLSYLHNDCVPPVVHRDVKSTNILLDADFRARIGDFGVAKAVEAAKSMSVIAGSLGYIAPEYAYTLRVSEKSDVYSFGVVLLELVTGRHPLEAGELGEGDLVRWVHRTAEEKGPAAVLDPSLGSEFEEEMFRVIEVALLCTSNLPINRPTMSKVVKMLLGGGVSGDGSVAELDGDEGMPPQPAPLRGETAWA
ncbi:unnamed protein product [Spirodela intermedia]|uniref:non-specific serine/threonine protein kinase n=2 Tax=Spirodela intermedia TaxID=51605 RepID=A0A7I8LF39_SPIIN|nr:unnamed protein product [Spirodela intermedia]